MSIFIWLTFVNLYLVNLCLIFVGSFQVSSDSWDRNDHLGLISGQNCTFGCMGMFLLQSWRLSTIYVSYNLCRTTYVCAVMINSSQILRDSREAILKPDRGKYFSEKTQTFPFPLKTLPQCRRNIPIFW